MEKENKLQLVRVAVSHLTDFFKPNFQKIKKIKPLISPQLRVPKIRTIVRLKGLVLGFHFGQVIPCRRKPPTRNFSFFPVPPPRGSSALRGLVVTAGYYSGLLPKDLLWKGMWLVFSIDHRLLRKLDFAKN